MKHNRIDLMPASVPQPGRKPYKTKQLTIVLAYTAYTTLPYCVQVKNKKSVVIFTSLNYRLKAQALKSIKELTEGIATQTSLTYIKNGQKLFGENPLFEFGGVIKEVNV